MWQITHLPRNLKQLKLNFFKFNVYKNCRDMYLYTYILRVYTVYNQLLPDQRASIWASAQRMCSAHSAQAHWLEARRVINFMVSMPARTWRGHCARRDQSRCT